MKGKLKEDCVHIIKNQIDALKDVIGNDTPFISTVEFYTLILNPEYVIDIISEKDGRCTCMFEDTNKCKCMITIRKEYVKLI